jgi:hypothetical protein
MRLLIIFFLVIGLQQSVFSQIVGTPYMTLVTPNPIINTFSASSSTIIAGSSTTLNPSFDQGSASINNGVGSVSSGQGYSVSPSVTTTYTLTVTNFIGKSTSQSITVYVNSISITSQPVGATVNANNFNSINVSATGTGILSYQWYDSSGPLSDYVSSTYRSNIPGSYYCIVTSTLNGVATSVTSSTVTVTHNSVAINTQPTNGMFGTGGGYQLSVSGSGSGTLSYQWFKGSNAITCAISNTYTATIEDAYQVEVTSTLNGVSNTLRSNGIYVTENRVTITSGPVDSYATAGYTTSLMPTYSYLGAATLTYQWYNSSGGAISGQTGPTLTTGVAGTYYIEITSTLNGTVGVATSTSATVTVVPAPVITSLIPDNYGVGLGSSTNLTPTFSNGVGVINPGNIIVTSGNAITISPTVTTSYSLTVTNLAGSISTLSINVIVTNGVFTYTNGNMNIARDFHSSTLLNNGLVLITKSRSGLSSIAELYNSNTGTFSTTGSMVVGGRYLSTTNLLSNGKVLIAGGSSNSDQSSAELYDPSTGLFSATGSMNSIRRYHAGTLLPNGKVLVTGGYASSGSPLSSAELYDPNTGLFSYTNSMSRGRSYHSSTLLDDGTVLIAGGYTANGNDGPYTNNAQLYNPSTGTYSSTGSMNEGRGYHTATKLNNGKVLIVGGASNNSGVYIMLSSAELYDPVTKIFTSLPSLPTRMYHHTATLLDNGLVFITGGQAVYNDFTPLGTGILFDPTTNKFVTEVNQLRSPRYFHSAVKLTNGTVLISGGYIQYQNTPTAEIYNSN